MSTAMRVQQTVIYYYLYYNAFQKVHYFNVSEMVCYIAEYYKSIKIKYWRSVLKSTFIDYLFIKLF